MTDALYTRENRLFTKDGKLLWNAGLSTSLGECCCIFLNCCVGNKDAEVVIGGLSDNVADTTCNSSNCTSLNNTYLVEIPGRSVLDCCVYGSLALGTVCQLGQNGLLSVSLNIDSLTLSNSQIAVSLDMRNIASGFRNQILWRETGTTAITKIWQMCTGAQVGIPFFGYGSFQGLQGTPPGTSNNLSCTGISGTGIVTQGYCLTTSPCQLKLI